MWRDEPARQALAWRAHHRGDLGRRERAYLDAVRDVATRAERRRRRVRRGAIAAVVAVPMILLAVGNMALVQSSRAEREASQQRDELRETTVQLRAQAAPDAWWTTLRCRALWPRPASIVGAFAPV